MGYGVVIRVRGDYALFTRPEMKVERVSYDVITPAIRWVIDKIHVLNEIEFTNVRRNEVSEKISTREAERRMKGATDPFFLDSNDKRQQRAALVLKNVDYVIEAHFELTDEAGEDDTEKKHYNIALRRLRKGQHFHAPYLGAREFGAQVELLEDGDIPSSVLRGERELGWMLYDLDFDDPADIRPEFFQVVMQDGVIDLTSVELRG